MRIYVALTLPLLQSLLAGAPVVTTPVVPASDDELDEFAAMSEAAGSGAGVIAADVVAIDQPLTMSEVASFHVKVDSTGDLAWYAAQEADAVLRIVRSTAPR